MRCVHRGWKSCAAAGSCGWCSRKVVGGRGRAPRHYLGALDGAAAPYRYEGVVRSAILRAKYEGESWTAVELGVEMTARLFGAEVEMHFAEPVPGLVSGAAIGYDCIVPVPATSRRRW